MTFQRLQANAKQIELRTYRSDLHFLRYTHVCFSQKKQFNLVVCITFVNLTFLSRLDLFASFSLTCHSNVDKKPRPFLLARIDMWTFRGYVTRKSGKNRKNHMKPNHWKTIDGYFLFKNYFRSMKNYFPRNYPWAPNLVDL